LLGWHPQAAIATLVTPLESEAEFRDANLVKVVTDKDGWALYFSRAPIPWPREGGMPAVMRHVGLYAYRAGGLRAITAAPPCELEQVEKLEQLRALWLGHRIIVETAAEPPAPAVDTEEDLAKVRGYLERSPRTAPP
jgi:3-deoxy-manno-octulosonate cytidylyltransferase (CMP-KDO synthetase)